jgi:hypothetical protein
MVSLFVYLEVFYLIIHSSCPATTTIIIAITTWEDGFERRPQNNNLGGGNNINSSYNAIMVCSAADSHKQPEVTRNSWIWGK